jgi:hypothetical protein
VIPQDVYQLEVALNAWASFLELCTVRRMIAARSLQRFLDGMEDIDATLEDMFLVSADFGLKIMLVLDNHLQRNYEMVAKARDVTRLGPSEKRFQVDRAEGLLQDLQERTMTTNSIFELLWCSHAGAIPRDGCDGSWM